MNNSKKVVTIIGARPQFIKAAPVSRVFRQASCFEEILVHTGQHFDENMSNIFFKDLEIPKPGYSLGIGGGNHGAMTGRMLEAIEMVLLKERPEWVIIYGDTNSTLAGALAAAKLHIPLAHVEAGLRSFNRLMPEEINRILSDHVSDLLFAPTNSAVLNLSKEGILGERVLMVGDVMYDSALFYGQKAERESTILEKYSLIAREYILATVHRAENTDDPTLLKSIFDGLAAVAKGFLVVLPLHPRTRQILERNGMFEKLASSLFLIDPVGYLDMVMLEKNARLIVTDSGGVQKEAFFYHIPTVTLRKETEWVELVDLGWNRLCYPDSSTSVERSVNAALCDAKEGKDACPYGVGDAAQKIVEAIIEKTI